MRRQTEDAIFLIIGAMLVLWFFLYLMVFVVPEDNRKAAAEWAAQRATFSRACAHAGGEVAHNGREYVCVK